MCLIIDTCSFFPVFKQQEARFAPIRRWLIEGKGKLIYGGATFTKELKGRGALSFLAELTRSRKLVHLDDAKVDAMEKDVRAKEPSPKFDDPHLVALVAISKCRVICTDDDRAAPYLTRKDLYPKKVQVPKIYSRQAHSHLCCNEHIVAICR